MLYVGLGTVAVGLIITFVGLGEKGFKTVQLKMIGPGLVGCGLVLTVIRIISCTLPACYDKREVTDKIKEEANGVIKNNNDKDSLARVGVRVSPSLKKNSLITKPPRHENNIVDNDEKYLRKMRRQSSGDDDLSSSSTFSDSEERIPPFLASKDKSAL